MWVVFLVDLIQNKLTGQPNHFKKTKSFNFLFKFDKNQADKYIRDSKTTHNDGILSHATSFYFRIYLMT